MEKRLKEIFARKAEIRSLLESGKECDLTAIQKELEGLETEERSIQERQEVANKINTGEIGGKIIQKPIEETRSEDVSDTIEYRRAFMDYVLKGKEIQPELRANAVTATTDIGAAIPTTILNTIIEKIEAAGMILPLVTRTAYKGGLSIPTSSVKPIATWVSEGKGSDKQKKGTDKVVFAYHKLRCAVAVTLESDTMALSAFEATLINNVTNAMIKSIEQAIISGDGNGKPSGILNETPVSEQKIETATCKYKDLTDAEGALPLEYETGAVWVMTKKTFMTLIGETDTAGQPIARVNTGINGKPERVLLGRQVVLCNYIDSFTDALKAGKPFAFLFDFSDYVLNTNYNMAIKKYEDNETDDLVTKAVMLVDGKVVDKNSLVVLVKKAA